MELEQKNIINFLCLWHEHGRQSFVFESRGIGCKSSISEFLGVARASIFKATDGFHSKAAFQRCVFLYAFYVFYIRFTFSTCVLRFLHTFYVFYIRFTFSTYVFYIRFLHTFYVPYIRFTFSTYVFYIRFYIRFTYGSFACVNARVKHALTRAFMHAKLPYVKRM